MTLSSYLYSSSRRGLNRELLPAIDARVKAGDLLREQAEAQVSGLLADIWEERSLRRLPGRVFLDRTQEKRDE